MVNSHAVHELLEIRRRMVISGLGLKPKDLRGSLDLPAPLVSFVLRGERRLSPKERAKLMVLVQRKIDLLFG